MKEGWRKKIDRFNGMNSVLIRYFLMLILGLPFFQDKSFGEECPTEEIIGCTNEKGYLEQYISLRHVEGSGLGYAIGYSSLDLFLSKSLNNRRFVPFLDLRGHIFNNGKYAGNAGLGLRYLNCRLEQIWGVYLGYDYLQHIQRYPHPSYHQVGGGLEIIGKKWDFHLNAYVPVGDKKTNIYRFKYRFYEELKRGDLSHFKLGLKAREQLALNGIDTLLGYRFCNICHTDLHISAGPYYYWGRTAKTTNVFTKKRESSWGGRMVFDIIFSKYISIGADVTYDTIFKWRSQGMICLNIPFSFFRNCRSRCAPRSLKGSLYNHIERNEIIAVDCLNRYSNNPNILDPEYQP